MDKMPASTSALVSLADAANIASMATTEFIDPTVRFLTGKSGQQWTAWAELRAGLIRHGVRCPSNQAPPKGVGKLATLSELRMARDQLPEVLGGANCLRLISMEDAFTIWNSRVRAQGDAVVPDHREKGGKRAQPEVVVQPMDSTDDSHHDDGRVRRHKRTHDEMAVMHGMEGSMRDIWTRIHQSDTELGPRPLFSDYGAVSPDDVLGHPHAMTVLECWRLWGGGNFEVDPEAVALRQALWRG